MLRGQWSSHHLLHLVYVLVKKKEKNQVAKHAVWKYEGLVCWKLIKECQPNSLLCQAYRIAEQIACDLVYWGHRKLQKIFTDVMCSI